MVKPDLVFYPIYQEDRKDAFTDVTLVQPWLAEVAPGVNVETAPLKPDTSLQLLELSQTDVLLAAGIVTADDRLGSGAVLTDYWLQDKTTGEVWKASDSAGKAPNVALTPIPFVPDGPLAGSQKTLGYTPDKSISFTVAIHAQIKPLSGEATASFLLSNTQYRVIGYSLATTRVSNPNPARAA